jgi:lysophospholipase L1-like esterase
VPGATGGGAADRGPKRIWLIAVLFGVVSSAVLAAIVVLATRSSSPEVDPRPRVAIVGDSITEQGESALDRTLGDDWRLSIDGRSGATVAEQLPAARKLARSGPSQVVVNLGTNDVTRGDDLDRSADDLRELVAAFPEATCIHLVTINEGIESDGVPEAPRARELNRAIAALSASDPRIDVIDWSAVVAAYEAGDQADGPIVTDTIHPSPRGQLALALRYREALAACGSAG